MKRKALLILMQFKCVLFLCVCKGKIKVLNRQGPPFLFDHTLPNLIYIYSRRCQIPFIFINFAPE